MTIGEMARRTQLPESTLRYYEKRAMLRPARDKNGRRVYAESDVAWVAFLQRLKETGMPLKNIQRYAALRYAGDSTIAERLEMLREHRLYVLDQQRKWGVYLQNLEEKIAFYEHTAAKAPAGAG